VVAVKSLDVLDLERVEVQVVETEESNGVLNQSAERLHMVAGHSR
jgi:hypothetical protein